MNAHEILSRFEKVRQHGDNRWSACCPAHPDKTPSLAIRLADNGRWLIHDFGGCETQAVLTAVGLQFSDLMPERLADYLPRVRRAFSDAQLLRIIGHEALRIALYASDRVMGKWPKDSESEEVMDAYTKIHAVLEYQHAHWE